MLNFNIPPPLYLSHTLLSIHLDVAVSITKILKDQQENHSFQIGWDLSTHDNSVHKCCCQ